LNCGGRFSKTLSSPRAYLPSRKPAQKASLPGRAPFLGISTTAPIASTCIHAQRRVAIIFFRHRFRAGSARPVRKYDLPSDALRFFRRDHFSGQAKLVRHSLPQKPRQAVAIRRIREEFPALLPLAEFRRLARDSNGARERQLASPPSAKPLIAQIEGLPIVFPVE